MAIQYDPRAIEPKWQSRWEAEQAFATPQATDPASTSYILDFFPYPSGVGLHVGHLLGYTGSDVAARLARMQGKQVLHPMGWDAFGLPAENYAIKTGVHPSVSTTKNTEEFKRQFSQVGISYDWQKEINTSLPEYYKWTQWFFSLLYKRGLAYRKEGMVNWCPKCQTVLANEQVVGGLCERCDSKVVQRLLKQWYFKITDYAERLLTDLDELDWPEKIKTMQRNWIGKSEGARLVFEVQNRDEKIEVFTTRADTVFGVTYMVLAPEHPLVLALTTQEQKAAVTAYIQQTSHETELERTFTDREKTGVFTGAYALNPATRQPVPIWIADYVLGSYGTGAIMAVPAHDERDYAFAQKFSLPIVQVIEGDALPHSQKGGLINSGEFSGKKSEEVLDALLQKIGGERQVTYRVRDWLVSRQRFWGAPIPIVYDQDGKEHLLPDGELPVKLPENVEFLPTGQSPLIHATDWKAYTDPGTGQVWQREVDTLDGFVCSSWYYLRFPTPHNDQAAFDPEAAKTWLPVDLYVGGADHAVLHLLYARFFTKVLYDAGLVPFKEPFKSLRNPGFILGPDNNKMSKSKGNVINPDDVVAEHGADTLRVYELFMAPFELEKPWNTNGIVGVRRFLERTWRLQERLEEIDPAEAELRIIHKVTKKVTEDIEAFKFNTAIASMMEALNQLYELKTISKSSFLTFITLLNPFAPHITEELWEWLGGSGFVSLAGWPSFDAQYIKEDQIEYPVQINGKVKFKLQISANTSADEVLRMAKEHPKTIEYLAQGQLKKEIVVPGRLVSLVIE